MLPHLILALAKARDTFRRSNPESLNFLLKNFTDV